MTQKRAKKGGEIGINGEPYKGGAFLPTTDRPKMLRRRPRPTRKMQVGPYEWANQPHEGATPIFVSAVGGVFCGRSIDGVNDTALAYLGLTRAELADRITRHAAGERWM